MVDGGPTVFLVGTFVEVSLDPTLTSVAVQKQSRTWEKLRDAGEINLSVPSTHHNAVVYQLGSMSADRLVGVDHSVGGGGAVLIDNSTATFPGTIEDEISAGDHYIVLLRVSPLP